MNKYILIVDDEQSILSVLDKTLKNDNYIIHTATSEKIAIELTETINFDLLITDMTLKNTIGIALIEVMRKLQPNIKAILMSGNCFFNKRQAKKLGLDAFISKPFAINNVRAVVQEVLNK